MKLYSECHWDGWDRIVDIYVERTDSIPEYIYDDSTYKILILEKGIIRASCGEEVIDVKAPAVILLSQKKDVALKIKQAVKAQIVFFKPSAIRDEFTFERIDSGEFNGYMGQAIYQDYILIESNSANHSLAERVIPVPMNGFKKIKDLCTSAECELKGQADGFWPCRSRSYLMELLYFIIYSYIIVSPENMEDQDADVFSRICEYLNEHISEEITLDSIVREFHINRNKLNDLFMKNASMTCISYLMALRMDLAKILLTKTEIPIGEISTRVGYPDPNYFAKLFRKKTGMSPSQFRRS